MKPLKLNTNSEAKQKVHEFLQDLRAQTTDNPFDNSERIWNNSIGIEASYFDGRVHISAIRSFTHGQGNASKALDFLCGLADKYGVEIECEAAPFGSKELNESQLAAWYRRHGFLGEDWGMLVRKPKGAEQPVSTDKKPLKLKGFNQVSSKTASSHWYHGTSSARAEQIRKTGMIEPDHESSYGADLTPREGCIYIASDRSIAKRYALDHGLDGVVFEVEVPDPEALLPDEDCIGEALDKERIGNDVEVAHEVEEFWLKQQHLTVPDDSSFEVVWQDAYSNMVGSEVINHFKETAMNIKERDPELAKRIIEASGKAAHVGALRIVSEMEAKMAATSEDSALIDWRTPKEGLTISLAELDRDDDLSYDNLIETLSGIHPDAELVAPAKRIPVYWGDPEAFQEMMMAWDDRKSNIPQIAKLMKKGDRFAPAVVYEENILDGNHRTKSAISLGLKQFPYIKLEDCIASEIGNEEESEEDDEYNKWDWEKKCPACHGFGYDESKLDEPYIPRCPECTGTGAMRKEASALAHYPGDIRDLVDYICDVVPAWPEIETLDAENIYDSAQQIAVNQRFEKKVVNLEELNASNNRPLKLKDVDRSMAGQSHTEGPIILDNDYSVIDGMHRLAQMLKEGVTTTEVWMRVQPTTKIASADLIPSILTEFMSVLKPGLPTPQIKIINSIARYLGTCNWKYGLKDGVPFGDDNTVIELQKSILGNEETLRRILAHELAHHEDYMVNDLTALKDKGYATFQRMKKYDSSRGHGKSWQEIAARFNAKYGADFVTPKSDESYEKGTNDIEFFVLFSRLHSSTKLYYSWAVRPSPKQKKVIDEEVAKGGKLIKTTDAAYMKGAKIGQGWSYKTNPEENAAMETLFAQGKTAKIATYSPFEEAAEDARNKVFGAGPASNGDCEPTSDALYDILTEQGYKAAIAYGFYKDSPHSWVQVGDTYIDPTHDQFGDPDIRIGKTSDPEYGQDYEINGLRSYPKTASRRLGDIFAIAMTEMLPLNDPQKFAYFNITEKSKVKQLTKAIEEGEELPPILVVQHKNGQYLVLDGNHRLEAALKAKKTEIEAYVVTWKDLKKVLNTYFDGEMPAEAHELDDYILLNDEHLEPYSKRASMKTANSDFGYSQFNSQKSDEVKNLSFSIEGDRDQFEIYATDDPTTEYGWAGRIECTRAEVADTQLRGRVPHGSYTIADSLIGDEWRGSGLGQVLYDKTIEHVKQLGGTTLFSDERLTDEAHQAWKRLMRRYPVTFDRYLERYRLELTSPKTAAGPTQDQDHMGKPGDITETVDESISSWMGSSKVVDEKGQPLLVYHGAAQWHDTIKNDKYTVGRFFSSSLEVAKAYGPQVFPAYLKMVKPLVVDAKDEFYDDIATPKELKGWVYDGMERVDTDLIADFAHKHGYDGVIIKNVIEPKYPQFGADDYIVFHTDQVRFVAAENAKQAADGPYEHESLGKEFLASVPDLDAYVDWVYEGRKSGKQSFVNRLLKRPPTYPVTDKDVAEATVKFKRQTAPLRGLKFPLDVFRAVRLPKGIESLNTEQIGVCWSYSEYAAKPIMAAGKGTDWMLHGRIDSPDFVDWGMSVSWALEKPSEKEVRLRKGAKVDWIEYREMNDDSDWTEVGRMVTAVQSGSEAPKWLRDQYKKLNAPDHITNSAWETIESTRTEVAKDNLNLAREKGFEITADDKLVLYHGTRSGEAIRKSGFIRPGSYLSAIEADARSYAGMAQRKGKAVVFRVEVYPGYGWLQGNGYFSTREPIPMAGAQVLDGVGKTADGPTQDQDFDDSMTQTPEFKRWFAGSKVTDDHGRPLRVYHGSDKDFDMFGATDHTGTELSLGSHFTADPDTASSFAEGRDRGMVYPIYLSLKNPVRAKEDIGGWGQIYNLFEFLDSAGIEVPDTISTKADRWSDLDEAIQNGKGDKSTYQKMETLRKSILQQIVAMLISEGYDGIVYPNEFEGGGDSWIAFRPEQIKSAIGNNGKFDPEDKSITASVKVASPEDLEILKDMLNLTEAQKGEELARLNYSHFREWVEENHEELMDRFPPSEDEELDDYSIFGEAVLAEYVEEGSSYMHRNDPAVAPSFIHMDYVRDVNDEWLIHFTDDAESIAYEGFTKGMMDPGMLGLTTYFDNDNFYKSQGGYNFAFDVADLHHWDGKKYGNQCVLFKASGIEVYHYGDAEPQVIFWGADAHSRIPITEPDLWVIKDPDTSDPLFEADTLKEVVQWGMTHPNLYLDKGLRNQLSKLQGDLLEKQEELDSEEYSTPRAGTSWVQYDAAGVPVASRSEEKEGYQKVDVTLEQAEQYKQENIAEYKREIEEIRAQIAQLTGTPKTAGRYEDYITKKDDATKTLFIDCEESEAGISDETMAAIVAKEKAEGYTVKFRSPMDDGSETNYQVMKRAYISPKEAILAVAVDIGGHQQVTLTLDLGIPNFTVFSIKLPVDGVELADIKFFIEQALEAMLDEVSAFMITMGYPQEEVVKIYKLTLDCFDRMGVENATDANFSDVDDNIRFYEAGFAIPQSFVMQTLDKVITAARKPTNSTLLYHGTTQAWWNKVEIGNKDLYLTLDTEEARRYALDAEESEAAQAEEAGLLDSYKPFPIVLSIPFSALKGYSLEPDWGWEEASSETSYIDSLAAVGNMVVSGDIQTLKPKFRLTPIFEAVDITHTASATQRLPPARHWEFTTLKPHKDDPAKTIQMYKSRSLKSTPRPYYVLLYNQRGQGVGALKVPKEWEKRLLKSI